MKIIFSYIDEVFDTECGYVNVLVIENQPLLFNILNDIYIQIEGYDGNTVISRNEKPIAISKHVELLTQFVPFELNQKKLVNKMAAAIEKDAMSGDHYVEVVEILSRLEELLINLSFEHIGDIDFPRINIGSILKGVGVEFKDTYDSLAEKVLDYLELVAEYDQPKLFILYGLRNLISDNEASLFMESIIQHGFSVLMIENCIHTKVPYERCTIIDEALCILK